jgi:hypothetical protein
MKTLSFARSWRAARTLSLPLFLVAFTCSLVSAEEYVPGKTYFGREKYVEYQAGELPIVITAPHGGRLKPEEIPDRTKGVFAFDVGTQELVRAIAKEFHERTGKHIHLVICRLHRIKLDCNREIVEAAGGNPLAESVWKEYTGFIKSATAAVEKKDGRGFFLDIHGHGHPTAQLELGYLHDSKQLQQSDKEIDESKMAAESSLHAIAAKKHMPYSQLLRGPSSLGALLEELGFPSAPSPKVPHPPEPFFRGGHTVRVLSEGMTPNAGLQIETNYKGVRDNDASREKFAKALVDALDPYLEMHMGMHLIPASKKARAKASE